jgi:16S rRNA (guanine527-N7)-methyltransferase
VTLEIRQAEQLAAFGELLCHWNRAFNLISRQDVDRVLPRHLLDSLSAGPWLAGEHDHGPGYRCRAAGGAAGHCLPGAALHPGGSQRTSHPFRQSRLPDALHRQRRALACDVAGLPAGRRFDTIVARAVADVAAVWRLGSPWLRSGGRMLVLWRGQSSAAVDDAMPVSLPGLARADHHEIRIPGLTRPHRLAVLEGEDGVG